MANIAFNAMFDANRLLQAENETDTCLSTDIGTYSYGFRLFGIVYTIIAIVIVFGGCAWWYLRRKAIYLRRRSPELLPLAIFAFICNLFTGPIYRSSSETENFVNSCAFTNFVFVSVAPFVVSMQVIRLYLFRNRVRFNRRLAEILEAGHTGLMSSGLGSIKDDSSVSTREDELRLLKRRSTSKHSIKLEVFAFIGVCLFSFSYSVVSCRTFINPDNECEFGALGGISGILVVAPIIILASLQLYVSLQTKGEPDPLGILQEIKYSYVVPIIIAFFSVCFDAIDLGGIAEQRPRRFHWGVLVDVGLLWYLIYSIPYRVYLSTREKKDSSYMGVSLESVLEGDTGFKLFQQYLLTEFSSENLAFWKAVQTWKSTYAETMTDVGSRTARNIYKRWVAPGAVLSVNVSHAKVRRVEEYFENLDPEGAVDRAIFDDISNAVFRLMNLDSFRRFKQDPLFTQFYGLEQPSLENVI
mmetsp:Transcript_11580/g.13397  ORF Transcript_11580/g.13397 Transcript_11580/m.13397 type:complete len:470 (-) Transcript_11580:3549-4958(-)